MNADLLNILCCPQTHQELRLAEESLLAALNRQIEGKTLHNCAGKPVNEKIEGGLLRADGEVLYPIRQNIPVLLVEEGINLA